MYLPLQNIKKDFYKPLLFPCHKKVQMILLVTERKHFNILEESENNVVIGIFH